MRIKLMVLLLWLGLLSGCSAPVDVWSPPVQQWHEFNIHIETRPEIIRPGMNEFLLIVNRQGKRHIPDLLVHIRTQNSKWKQAMPDGALGVYRRALMVKDMQHEKLFVRLRHHGRKGALDFDLFPTSTTTE
ncbi:MAG: hypothetical protein R8K49_07800 [Mariprofundaceae bacterium]